MAIAFIAAYSDSDNNMVNSVDVLNVAVGDLIVACFGGGYADPAAMSIAGAGAGTYVAIGGNIGNTAVFENSAMIARLKLATGTGTYTVSTSGGGGGESCLAVVHLGGATGSLDGTCTDTVINQSSSNGTIELGSKTSTEVDTLLVAMYGQEQFSGTATWTPPDSMTERVDVRTPNNSQVVGLATQPLASIGSSGAKTATCSVTAGFGNAGKLFLLQAVPEAIVIRRRSPRYRR